jgi:dienelactone hydrolase
MATTPVHYSEEIFIPTEAGNLPGFLDLPRGCTGLVLFAHGSGSSRFSRRNRAVASVLVQAGLATLLFDLLTAAEGRRDDRDRSLRFDIPLLSRRLIGAIDWASSQADLGGLPIGLFGASTGAAAAVMAAAARPARVGAVVSRGGRPDLAAEALARVASPTLFIVGGADVEVLQLNRRAAARLTAAHELQVVPGASHLFEEPGTLEQVARLARNWFLQHLPPSGCAEDAPMPAGGASLP